MKLTSTVNQEQLMKLRKFGHKVATKLDELRANPTEENLEAYKKIEGEYLSELSHFSGVIKAESINAVLKEKSKDFESAAVVTDGGNTASGSGLAKKNQDEQDGPGEVNKLTSTIKELGISLKKKMASGTSKGTKSQNRNRTSKKDSLDQWVARERRIRFWLNEKEVNTELALRVVLNKHGFTWYKMSQRKSGHQYKLVTFKKKNKMMTNRGIASV